MPLILILMTITGAVYPAIDLTAGERERGTLETLIASPVPRMQLLFAKYAAVVTVALLTAVVNLAAMIATVSSIGLTTVLFGTQGRLARRADGDRGLLVLFAAFFSAVLLAVTSFARSFKEAQAYLIPLMLVSITPGMLSMIPGLKLQGPLVVTPLLNIVLLARDLFSTRRRTGDRLLGRHLDGPVRGGGDRRRGPHLRDRRHPLRQPRNVVRPVSPPDRCRPPRRRRAACYAWP